ncbi:MAG: ACT domain-containing protein [Ilumatobacteraceae bacterium]
MATLVLTVVGDDRPGLVDSISGAIRAHGGNWERSQMARLGGKFAGIVQVQVPDAGADELRSALAALGDQGLLVVAVDQTDIEPAADGHRFTLALVGTDRPGLVHSVSAALAAIGASIEELVTDTTSAPMSGGSLFEATVTVVLPPSLGIDEVRTQLEALADHLMVDIEFTE